VVSLVDCDIVYKATLLDLDAELIRDQAQSTVGVLGATRFVLTRKFNKLGGERATAMRGRLDQILSNYLTVEPSGDEIGLAAEFESAAQLAGLSLDVGESQLCSILLTRDCQLLLTGDKRAIVALQKLLPSRPQFSKIARKVKCLEQCVDSALKLNGVKKIRDAVCASIQPDIVLAICFSCKEAHVGEDTVRACLSSYIQHLRDSAPDILSP
jgi:hypothetical protein